MRLLAYLTLALFFLLATGRAIDHEYARAQPVTVVESGRYQGKTARWWAKRAVQARKDANARGRTIKQLKRIVAAKFIPAYWVRIASCESGVAWGYNGKSGFDGALQFHPTTWRAYRLPSYPQFAYQASPFQQLVVGELVLAAQGWGAWPACSRKLGLR